MWLVDMFILVLMISAAMIVRELLRNNGSGKRLRRRGL